MPGPVFGDGPLPSRLMLVGERPGPEEYEQGRGFVGRSGDELWARLWRIARLQRRDFYVTNLVKTFNPELKPPTPDEVRQWERMLYRELVECQPDIIVTVGYHAARWFLPRFAGMSGDFFHGLAFDYAYGQRDPMRPVGDIPTRHALVVPMIHAAAALRQPERYQAQLTDDCAAVRRVVKGEQRAHDQTIIVPYESGLAGYLNNEQLGLDTEGSVAHPEAITLSHTGDHAYLGEVFEHAPSPALAPAVLSAQALYIHAAKHDWQVLDTPTFGIDLTPLALQDRLHDSMELAYLLHQPQSLKVLAYRLFGVVMQEYSDLVRPYDDEATTHNLGVYRGIIKDRVDEYKALTQAIAKEQRACATVFRQGVKRAGKGLTDRVLLRQRTQRIFRLYRARYRARTLQLAWRLRGNPLDAASAKRQARALTSIAKILATSDEDKSYRARWKGSALYDLAPLPPAVTWRGVPADKRQPYARLDAVMHRRVGVELHQRVKAQGLEPVYRIDMRALPMLTRMEQIGMACDGAKAARLAIEFKADYEAVLDRIEAHAGRRINPNAWETVADTLFNELGITPTRRLKSGAWTTQDKYLKARRGEHEIVNDIIEARQIGKLLTSYAVKLPKMLREGRYHADWRYTRVPTGRLAEPLIVLIPKHSHRGRLIRSCFHATEGHDLVLCDLSQIEMRVMAHLAKDEPLLQWYRDGVDVHTMTAHLLLGAPKRKEDQDESLHRLPSKTINFLIINMGSEYGLLDQLHEQGQLHWDIESVREFHRDWFKLHKGVDAYFQDRVAFARQHGYVDDLFGRRRRIDGIWSSDTDRSGNPGQIVREAERQSLCAIQATADGISKIWNDRIWRELVLPARAKGTRYCEPWVRVHDETVLEVDSRAAKQTAARMLQLVPQLLSIPTTAESVVESYWGQHKLEKRG